MANKNGTFKKKKQSETEAESQLLGQNLTGPGTKKQRKTDQKTNM